MKNGISTIKKLLLERSLRCFLLIGLGNTVLSVSIQLILYSYLRFGYWASSALAFCIASVSSFFLNRRFSFQSKNAAAKDGVRFALNIALCYLAAYSAAKPLVLWTAARFLPESLSGFYGQIALIFGNCLFTCLNYFGQRFFVFVK